MTDPMERTCSHGKYPEEGCESCPAEDRYRWEVSKWGRHWVAQLRKYPADDYPDGYVTAHLQIKGGKRGALAAVKDARAKGMDVVILTEA